MLGVNYITNLPQSMVSGGWSGMNSALHSRLGRYFDLSYIGPVNPRHDLRKKISSKALRLMGLPGNYHFFSNRRLDTISRMIDMGCTPGADFDFYLGATPWVRNRSERPYFAYVDASFSTYVSLYQRVSDFSSDDLSRIKSLEKTWMMNAAAVFFSSEWALRETRSEYGLHGENFIVAGVGGNIEVPEADSWAGEMNFLAVVTDFERKGGRTSFEAFKTVQHTFPQAKLIFVGVSPPDDILAHDGVVYKGFLHKDVPEEKALLVQLFSEAFALLLPSSADATPIAIAELGYFGCPTIAPRQFGIPEMISDGQTGMLINAPPTADTLEEAMLQLCRNDNYRDMRRDVRRYAMDRLNWDEVVERIASGIVAIMEKRGR